jgi:hypothetical protein
MKKKWKAYFTGPNGDKKILLGILSAKKMRTIISGMGYHGLEIDIILSGGEFNGLYNVEFYFE